MRTVNPPRVIQLRTCFIFGCILAFASQSLRAEVRLPSIFSEHLVLARAEGVPVWGKASPGEHVRVTIDSKTAETAADASGRWRAELNLKDSAAGPFELTVEGQNRIVIRDALVGEVWLASGQSNMEHPLRATLDADREITGSANPFLRQFLVKRAGANRPADDCEGRWTAAGPDNSGEFTAVGYYFGKELQQARNRPVGIINSSHGGTYIEPWIPADVFERVDSFRISAGALRRNSEEYPKQKARFAVDFKAWLKEHNREDAPRQNPALYADDNVSTADWQAVTLPGKVSETGFPSSGVFWIRRDVEVSALPGPPGLQDHDRSARRRLAGLLERREDRRDDLCTHAGKRISLLFCRARRTNPSRQEHPCHPNLCSALTAGRSRQVALGGTARSQWQLVRQGSSAPFPNSQRTRSTQRLGSRSRRRKDFPAHSSMP